jgi:hypothetical protein
MRGASWAALFAAGQVFDLSGEELPAARQINVLYAFYVFSQGDAPAHAVPAAGLPTTAWLRNVNLSFVPPGYEPVDKNGDPRRVDLKDLAGLQLVLVRYESFLNLFDFERFCCDDDLIAQKKCTRPNMLAMKRVPAEDEFNEIAAIEMAHSTAKLKTLAGTKTLNTTGLYLLLLSNCGPEERAPGEKPGKISGEVIVRNPYGFLPGVDYPKKSFYAGLTAAHVIFAAGWFALLARWWSQCFHIHWAIGVVIVLGLIESAAWYFFYLDWNYDGRRSTPYWILALGTSEVRAITSYMLLLVACIGWGITCMSLEPGTVRSIKGISVLYLILDTLRHVAATLRYERAIEVGILLFCLFPISALNGVIFYWVMSSLGTTIESLEESKQTEKLRVFQGLSAIMTTALLFAGGSFVFEVWFVTTLGQGQKWRYQWLSSDATWRLLTFGVLFAVSVLWLPNKEASRYVYSQQIDQDDQGELGEVVGRPDDPFDEEMEDRPDSTTELDKF